MLFVVAVILAVFVVPAPWGLVLVGAAGIVEIGESYIWMRISRRHRIKVGAETLIGSLAEVVTECRPEGQVRIQGELWRARCQEGADRGDVVRVVARNDLTLLVERT
ncbi:MAG TPA: NfeD family protein [Gaiellaceae bacterium]|jgi:membrane protein implicated in regulation of membrane protease activity